MLIAFLFLCCTYYSSAQTFQSSEANIKAVFLYNFTQFVEWPSGAFPHAESPFVIGILGDDPFKSAIDEAVAGEKVKGHSIIVQRYATVKDIRWCHILFVSNKEAANLKEIRAALLNKNTLTVSDNAGFAKEGGMIRFINQENKIKLQINPSAAKAADINISSKLLRLADIVRPR